MSRVAGKGKLCFTWPKQIIKERNISFHRDSLERNIYLALNENTDQQKRESSVPCRHEVTTRVLIWKQNVVNIQDFRPGIWVLIWKMVGNNQYLRAGMVFIFWRKYVPYQCYEWSFLFWKKNLLHLFKVETRPLDVVRPARIKFIKCSSRILNQVLYQIHQMSYGVQES